MRLKSVFVSTLLVMSASFAVTSELPLEELPEVADGIAVFERWAEQTITHRSWPGLSIAVVYDQEIVWSEGYGYADLEKKTAATSAIK